MMDEHIAIGHRYHGIRINTTYSYGLDDQEFVVAFEGDDPGRVPGAGARAARVRVVAVHERDTPMFTCRRMAPAELAAYCGLPPNEA